MAMAAANTAAAATVGLRCPPAYSSANAASAPRPLAASSAAGASFPSNAKLPRQRSAAVAVRASTSHTPPAATDSDKCLQIDSNLASSLLSGLRKAAAAASVALVLSSSVPAALAADVAFQTYYGTAASASSYGGYGGNSSKRDTAEYVYDVPLDWKERAISKVEKGTNGTDSEFFNPKKKKEKTYLTFLAGFRKLPPKDNVLNDLALSDVDLQDLLASADTVEFKEKTVNNQPYYEFDIDSPVGHALVTVTSAKNKLYSHFIIAPLPDWDRDEAMLREIQASFRTVGVDPLAPPDQF